MRDGDRQGGLGVWAPSVTPPAPELTDEQQLACAFRILAIDGFCENLAGHITWQRPGQENLLVNPWGLWWRELTASDVCEVDMDANVVGGRWDVTPAIHIHTELHRRRPDARVVIHNHPYWATVLSAVGVLPELVNQTGAIFYDDLVLVEEYGGEVDSPLLGAELAEAIGDAPVAILANHGVIVTGATVAEAMYRAASLDRVCRSAYDVMLMGKDPLKMPPGAVKGIKQSFLERAVDVYWAGATRLLIKDEPEVLS
jgi:ribulose-5-phosphate 4-epimerase/fuculose-1-phosphate aldolase